MRSDQCPWVDGLTVGGALRAIARRHPDHEALVFPQHGFRATYGEYDLLVDRAARGLLALGIEKGDHVALWATNWPEWAILQLASARIGAVLVTVNPAYRTHELQYALEQSDARALFLIARFKSSDYFAMIQEVCPELAWSRPGRVHSAALPELEWVVSLPEEPLPGAICWKEMVGRGREVPDAELHARETSLDPAEAINLQYTSGTTGVPKGVLLSHRNLLLNAYYVGEGQRLTTRDRVAVPVPFYHCFGAVIGTLGCLVRGATMLVPSEYFEPGAVLDCLERECATSIYGVPTMFIALLDHESFPSRQLALRTGIMAGSPCPVEVMKRVVEDMGARDLTIAYGLTEASPAITLTDIDDPFDLRVSTVGRPIPGVEVRVVDPGTGETVPEGQPGELQARGHNVMLGYYRMPEMTRAAIDEDGWLKTGDLAVQQSGGYFRITGRIKDVIIRGGENIYPREIEDLLYTHPAVESAQVVGVPDPRFGEEVCAWVKLREGATATDEELRTFCRERLAHFKVPRFIRFVDEFPLTITGKVQKYKMREESIRELGLEELTLAPAQ